MTEHRFSSGGDIGAPYQPSSDTSRDAAKAIAGHVSEQRTDVYRAIIRAGSSGATWQELAERLGISPTSNGRVSELRDLGLIVDSGRRRKTQAGRNAVVWIAAPMKERS